MELVKPRFHEWPPRACSPHREALKSWISSVGRVDLAELRPAIGLASSALSHEVLGGEKVRDVVVSGAYGVIGRWREEYEDF